MAFLELENIAKYFGQTAAVEQINLSIQQGEFLTLLGPSGCGKTTILRIIAGFETPTHGTVTLDDEDITYRATNRRPMGMVFQSYALFPHMTAEQNIAFGMQIQRKPGSYIQRRCNELLELVSLGGMGKRYPHQLSGGQQQRVAIARALAVEPKVLLLDEPLSALDAKVRVSLRNEIRQIQQQLKMTAIYVTHDQEEALAISDRIAVMAKGKIEQLDQPEVIYSNPHTIFAASFVGTSNQFEGTVEDAAAGLCRVQETLLHVPPLPHLRKGNRVLILIRPESAQLQARGKNVASAVGLASPASQHTTNNELDGIIELRTFLGSFTRFHIYMNEQTTLVADIPSQHARDYDVSDQVTFTFPAMACRVFPLDTSSIEMERLAEKV